MLKVRIADDEIRIGKRFSVAFQRTLRIPDDGGTWPLPPGLGRFPLLRVADLAGRVPAGWKRRGGAILPMYQSEALWLAFDGASWKPNAVQVGIGGVNAVSGGAWDEGLSADPQNYLVCPDQLWLDGINAGAGVIRQFVAMPLGTGTTVEAQLTGREEVGGIQIRAFEPKPGRFPDKPPRAEPEITLESMAPMMSPAMGLGAGGRMQQKIYPDPYGLDTWDPGNSGEVFVHIVNSEQYEELTGHPPPPTPVSAAAYTEHGLPWFALYEEDKGDVAASRRLTGVKSVREKEAERGKVKDEETVKIRRGQVRKIRPSGPGRKD
jgi:hypothetical protein